MESTSHAGSGARTDEWRIRVSPSLDIFGEEEWAGLAGASRNRSDTPYNPFISYHYLKSLEDSGCASRHSGWLGQHLRLERADGSLLGALPCYLKSHSQGEYVFDHGWADAFERAGGRYYPKLQSSIPFTPAVGPRLLVHECADAPRVRAALAGGLRTLVHRLDASSAHVTFLPEAELPFLTETGFLHRTDQQFHFFNRDYGSYEDFLSTLSSRKRKALRKERRTALQDDISVDWLTGSDLTEAVWDDFYAFYMDTGSRKWGRPYLNREFFSLIGERMGQDVLLVMARRAGRYVAGAINFMGSHTLFGRHWGCIEDHPYLHFEICYHQAIDYAIANRLQVVEAGAQGEHKLARGYMPVTTHSAHYIVHDGLREAVSDYLDQERQELSRIGTFLEQRGPFRRSTP